MSLTALLLLTDSRVPAGGHAHSGGVEAAVRARLVTDVESLTAWLRGRLATGGLVAAAFAAAAARLAPGTPPEWADLDRELDARTPAAAQRRASRAQGRSLLRVLVASHGDAPFAALRKGCGPAPHQPLVFGTAAAIDGVTPRQIASGVALNAMTGPASAAVRLLALDPLRVHSVLVSLTPDVERVAAAASVARAPSELPAASSPLLDILAEHHATQEGRLFAS